MVFSWKTSIIGNYHVFAVFNLLKISVNFHELTLTKVKKRLKTGFFLYISNYMKFYYCPKIFDLKLCYFIWEKYKLSF